MEQRNPRDMQKLKAKQIFAKDANHCYYFFGAENAETFTTRKNCIIFGKMKGNVR